MADQSPAVNALPFQTPIARIGREGLQLSKSLDELSMQEVSQLANLYHSNGDLQTRLGQTLFATLGLGTVHSIRRMNMPLAANYTRFAGAGTAWVRGKAGVITTLDSGLSGNPISLLPVRPSLSGEPWMVMGDTLKIRKASGTDLAPSLPVGLPVPGTPTVAVNAAKSTAILAFDAGDGSQASAWTALGGKAVDGSGVYLTAPVLSDIVGTTGNGVNMATQVDPAVTLVGYWDIMTLAKVLDLTKFSDATATSDEDIIHLSLRMDNPAGVKEVRLYFVVSAFTLASGPSSRAIPGADPAFNTSAYVHTYRPSDYAAFAANTEALAAAQGRIRSTALLQGFSTPDPSIENLPGANAWTQFGIVDLPVRRGDFLPVGAAGQAGTDWSTVNGIYIMVTTTGPVSVNVAFDDLDIRGGYGPDTSEPGSSQYDYRTTNYDPRTGAESNGSDTLAASLWVDAVRQSVTITPSGVPTDPALRQGFYRRGGSLGENWYFLGFNTTNGGAFTDTLTDLAIATATTLPVDHFQPVATVTSTGATVLAQPLPILFGPFDDGTVCGLGDPYRPGHLYACLAGQIDHWPSTGGYAVEVCSPSEELMNGAVVGGAGFVLSRERGYTVHTSLTGGTGIVVTPTNCVPGLAARWGFCVGSGGIYYVARDGIRVTNGGDSVLLSDAIWPLFHNRPAAQANYGVPIDFTHPEAIRLSLYDTDLWFLYQDVEGTRQCLIFSLTFRYWRSYTFAKPVAVAYADETQNEQDAQGNLQLLLGSTTGSVYTYAGVTDDGTPIAWFLRTGAWHWNLPREEKLLGDVTVEADLRGTTLTAQLRLNNETVINTAQAVTGAAAGGRTRYTFDAFGTTPQHARNVTLHLSGTAPTAVDGGGRPYGLALAWAGIAYATQPEITMNRATTWEPLNPGVGEAYLKGCWIDSDTGGSPRTILVEGLLNGVATATIATLTVNNTAGRRQWFSWPAVHVDMVRLRPTGACAPWMLFGCGWLHDPEPPRIATWDTNFETAGDLYLTGLDIECDTFNLPKTLVVTLDGVAVGGSPFTVTGNGRSYVHLTITPARGHILRFSASDANPGLLYTHKWLFDPEPEEQTHWNAAYTVYNSLSDKYLKGIIIEADTFGAAKTVNVEADGVVVATITPVTHSGRAVKNYTFPQVLGRVFRIIPTDTNPSRLYTAQPLFDEEPFALSRWETQLLDFNLPQSGWGSLFSADVSLKSTAVVTLSVAVYDAQGRLLQTLSGVDVTTQTAGIVSTGGAKQKRYVTFAANKGVLFKLIFTSADGSAITIYKEEGRLRLQPWSGGQTVVKTFGNDDLDLTREMTKAAIAAGRQGGAAR